VYPSPRRALTPRDCSIVTLLGVERVGRKLNILMEFVPGNSLATLLERYGPLTENVARSYARQLVSAVAFCHTHNVVHRDIKGKNVLVVGFAEARGGAARSLSHTRGCAAQDTLGRLKLADFGSAKQFADAVAKDNASLTFNYTPLWTAPEVLTGSYNAKVDVWSLGCVLLEMFTARPPWAEHNLDNPFRAIYHIGSTNATPRLPDSASPAARDFMSRCLTRDPDARWSAEQLAAHPWLAAPSRPSSPPASPRAAATASAVARAPGPAPAAPPEENSSDNEGEGEGGSS
jgi:mitogen-activated protein kinase kinase kinase 19